MGNPMPLHELLSHRLIVVTGKGGVGRTTLSSALGIAAARSGRRAAVVEMSGAAEVARCLGFEERAYRPRTVEPRLDTFSMTARECLEDFGARKLGLGALTRRLLNNRVTRAFFEAVPGLHDLQQLGRLENLLLEPLPDDPIYDVVILDAPATGHGLTLLSAARSMREMTRVGPFTELAALIESFLSDQEKTALVLATLPETLPVHESVELAESLAADGGRLSAVLVNQMRPPPLPESPPWSDVKQRLIAAGSPWDEVATIAGRSVAAFEAQEQALAELRSGLPDLPILPAPRVPATHATGRAFAIAEAWLEAA